MKKRFLYKKKKIIGILVVAFMLATSIGTIIQFFPAEFGVNANTANTIPDIIPYSNAIL